MYFFLGLTALANTYGIMLKKSDEKEYLSLSLIQMGKVQVSHPKM